VIARHSLIACVRIGDLDVLVGETVQFDYQSHLRTPASELEAPFRIGMKLVS
jgi:hypothetical protein